MATLGQVNSLFSVAWVEGADVVLASCELEPNSWLKRLPIELLEAPDDAPNMLPPPQPASAAAAAAISASRAACFERPVVIAVSGPASRKDEVAYSRAKTANQRRNAGAASRG